LKIGGAAVIRTRNSTDDLFNTLLTKFNRSLLEVNIGFIIIRKPDEVNTPPVIKRTNSKLT
jgi:hypothetical protein